MNAIPLTKGISCELSSPHQPAISEPQICGTVAHAAYSINHRTVWHRLGALYFPIS